MFVHELHFEGLNKEGGEEAVGGERMMKVRRKGVPACQGNVKDTDADSDADADLCSSGGVQDLTAEWEGREDSRSLSCWNPPIILRLHTSVSHIFSFGVISSSRGGGTLVKSPFAVVSPQRLSAIE